MKVNFKSNGTTQSSGRPSSRSTPIFTPEQSEGSWGRGVPATSDNSGIFSRAGRPSVGTAVATSKKQGGVVLNLPPIIDTKTLYELLFIDNKEAIGAVEGFAKALLINRTKHEAWNKIKDYQKQFKQEIDRGATYHYSYSATADYNLSKDSEGSFRSTLISTDSNNSIGEAFRLAPMYKIQLEGSTGDPTKTLTIEIFDYDANEKIDTGQGRHNAYSYEEYVKNYRLNKNSNVTYDTAYNNRNMLKLPSAIVTRQKDRGATITKALFNINILDFDVLPSAVCKITMENCGVIYDKKFYQGNDPYVATIGYEKPIVDLNGSTIRLLSEFQNSNHDAKFDSYSSILRDNIPYAKLFISGLNVNSRVEFKNFYHQHQPTGVVRRHAEIRDMGYFLDILGTWFSSARDASGKKLDSLYSIPIFQPINVNPTQSRRMSNSRYLV